MKKISKFLIITTIALIMLMVFVGCKKDETITLKAPENIVINGSVISWDAVENATGYEVVVDNNTDNVISTVDAMYTENLTELGSHSIMVRAFCTLNDEKIYSDYSTFTFDKKEKLAMSSVTINGKVASWDAVENASGYYVKVINISSEVLYEGTITETSYSFDESSVAADEQKYSKPALYTIYVTAKVAENETKYSDSNSAFAYYCVTTQVEKTSITAITSTSVRWKAMTNATGYTLYLYYVGANGDELVETYDSSTNSYALSYLDFETKGVGTYYVLIKALGDKGDNKVYLDSDISEREKDSETGKYLYDLKVIDNAPSDLTMSVDSNNKTWVEFKLDSIDDIEYCTIYLKAYNADESSSLTTIDKKISLGSGTFDCTQTTDTTVDTSKKYYEISNADTQYREARNYTKIDPTVSSYNAAIDYYRMVGDTSSHSYELLVEDNYYKVDNLTINLEPNDKYYMKDSNGVYSLYEVMDSKTAYADLDDTTTYYTLNDSNEYVSIGTKSEITEGTYDKYYYQVVFALIGSDYYYKYNGEEFDKAANYYTRNNDLTSFESGVTYYEFNSVTYKLCIDDLFFTIDENGNYEYVRSDMSYYGKLFTISMDMTGTSYQIIVPDAITCKDQYLSYKKPNLIDSSISYATSSIKGYFDSEDEYNTFVSKYNGYFGVETIGELQYINYESDKNYVLLTDLDNLSYNWVSIPAFSGTLDGNNHTIKNLVIKADKNDDEAGFIKTNNGIIKDVYFINSTFKDDTNSINVGLVVFANESTGIISNVYVSGNIKGAYIGAGLAYVNEGEISYSQSDVDIASRLCSGFVHLNYGNIKSSSSLGDITATDNYISLGDYNETIAFLSEKTNETYDHANDAIYVYENLEYKYLGLGSEIIANNDLLLDSDKKYDEYFCVENFDVLGAGFIYKNSGEITYSYSQGSISAVAILGEAQAAGFVVDNTGTIESSFAGPKFSSNSKNLLKVSAESDKTNSEAAGFVVKNSGTISYCYSTLQATAQNMFGGFVASNLSGATIEGCYSTGGIGIQTSGTQGAFLAKNEGTVTSCYFYNAYTTQTQNNNDSYATRATSVSDLIEKINALNSNKFATISDVVTPAVVGIIYVEEYETSIGTGSYIKTVGSYATVVEGSVVTYSDIVSDSDNFDYIVIGSVSVKGSALVIYQNKTTNDRVVIKVTIK